MRRFAPLLGLLGLWGCQPKAVTPPPPPDKKPPQETRFSFTDAQEKAGVQFVHTDGSSGRHIFVEQFCSGVAFLDYDRDGYLDIYVVNGAPLPGWKGDTKPRHHLWHNRGDGTFEEVTDRAGLGTDRFGGGVCAGDYDNDGWTDLYVTCFGKNLLYRNLGNGTFREVAESAKVAGTGGISTSTCFFDYDNDGWLDLYVCRYVQYRVEEDRFCGKGRTKKTYCGPEVFPSQPDILYHNNRDGTFTDVSRKSGIIQPRSKSLGVVPTDVNDDGWPDLYVACDLEPNLLLINNRNGTFSEKGVAYGVAYNADGAAEAGMGVTAGDYNNDGKIDLFVTNYSFEMNALYQNTGNELFTYESQRSGVGPPSLLALGFGTRFADFDNDGWQDVIVTNGHVLDDIHEQNQALEYAQPLALFHNQKGQFVDVSREAGSSFQSKYVGRGLAIGDYDRDGRLDVLINNNKGPLRLIHNETTGDNRWISLLLVGSRGNRSAIGARVTVKTTAGEQVQEVASGGSYLSQSDFRLHFGLGSAAQVDEVRVRWPGSGGKPGPTEVWKALPTNQQHTLTEGASRTLGGVSR